MTQSCPNKCGMLIESYEAHAPTCSRRDKSTLAEVVERVCVAESAIRTLTAEVARLKSADRRVPDGFIIDETVWTPETIAAFNALTPKQVRELGRASSLESGDGGRGVWDASNMDARPPVLTEERMESGLSNAISSGERPLSVDVPWHPGHFAEDGAVAGLAAENCDIAEQQRLGYLALESRLRETEKSVEFWKGEYKLMHADRARLVEDAERHRMHADPFAAQLSEGATPFYNPRIAYLEWKLAESERELSEARTHLGRVREMADELRFASVDYASLIQVEHFSLDDIAVSSAYERLRVANAAMKQALSAASAGEKGTGDERRPPMGDGTGDAQSPTSPCAQPVVTARRDEHPSPRFELSDRQREELWTHIYRFVRGSGQKGPYEASLVDAVDAFVSSLVQSEREGCIKSLITNTKGS